MNPLGKVLDLLMQVFHSLLWSCAPFCKVMEAQVA